MPSENEIKTRVRAFLARFFRDHQLTDEEDIFATGYVNSMFAMQLVQFVEGDFNVAVESEDLELDNFRSVNAITALIERKTAGVA